MSLAIRNDAEIQKFDDSKFRVIKDSLYPEATDQEAHMIMDYCRARRIDPMLKPVHLMEVSYKSNEVANGKAVYKKRKVVLPGIALYRIDASRSGQYAGMDEPIFGEDITEKVGYANMTYPKWCKIVVRKIVQGQIFEFAAVEYWKENYKTKGRDDLTPNDTWAKRAYGMLAKCTEAQALRKAFPDIVGNEYTYEEMQGIHHDEKPKLSAQERFINADCEVNNIEIKAHVIDTQLEDDLLSLSQCQTMQELQDVYKPMYTSWINKRDKEAVAKIMAAKDKRKDELTVTEFNAEIDADTGEVQS